MTEIFISNNPFEPDDSQFIFIERKENYDKDRNIYLDQVAEEKGIVFLPRAIREELGCEVDVFYDSIMPNLPDIYSPIYDNVKKGLDGECGIIHFTGYTSQQGHVYSYWSLGNKNLRECDFAQLKKDIEELEFFENYFRNIRNSSSPYTQCFHTERGPYYLYRGQNLDKLDINEVALEFLKRNFKFKGTLKKMPKLVLDRERNYLTGVYKYKIHFEEGGKTFGSFSIAPNLLPIYIALIHHREGLTLNELDTPNIGTMRNYYKIAIMPHAYYYGEGECKKLLNQKLMVRTSATNKINQINMRIKKALGEKYEPFLPVFQISLNLDERKHYVVARGNLVDITAWNNTKTEYEAFLETH